MKQISTSKTKLFLSTLVMSVIIAFDEFFANRVRFPAILLCSLRKSVCMDASPGWTMALVSPAVRSFAVGFGFPAGNPHWDLMGRWPLPNLLVLL